MAEALNYTRRALKDLRITSDAAYEQGRFKEAQAVLVIEQLLADINEKFVLPAGGRILMDGLRGLKNIETIRLPYPRVILEFPLPYDDSPDVDRAIVLASEDIQNERIVFFVIMDYASRLELKGRRKFTAAPLSFGVPMKNPIAYDKEGGYSIQTKVVSLLGGELPAEQRAPIDLMVNDVSHSIFELVECLSCRNVRAEKIPHKHSDAKHAALGFDEYKELIVYVGDDKVKLSGHEHSHGGSYGGKRREHLRRGHIRRHPSAGNIWVNATVQC